MPTVAPLERRYHFLCAAAAVAQLVTLRWTWDLWVPRSDPPNLAMVGWLSSISWGWVLVALCVVTVVRPRWGGPAFGVALVLACLGDQTRLQPGVISVAILMIAPAFGDNGRAVARWHLCSLWLWAGLHKALSTGWPAEGGNAEFIAESLGRPELTALVVVAVPLAEIVLGLTALWPRLWPVTGVGGAVLHVGVLVSLSPIFADWNSSVWPWNAAVAVAAPILFLGQHEGAAFPSRPMIMVAAVLLAYPVLFYVGAVDAYLSHNLYTSNTASAKICWPDEKRCSRAAFSTWESLNVPLPPEPRLFRQSFRIVCERGDVLHISGIRTRLTSAPSVETKTCR